MLKGRNSDTSQIETRENYDPVKRPVDLPLTAAWPPALGDVLNVWPGTETSTAKPALPSDNPFPGVGGGGGISAVATPADFLNSLGKTPGATAFIRQVGGVIPVLTGFREAQGNLGFDTTAGATNIIRLFFDGVDHWYTIFGAVVPTAQALVKRAITWASPPTVTVNGDIASFSGAGASISTPINTAAPFEVLFRSSRLADVFILDDAIPTVWTWSPPGSPSSAQRVAGAYFNAGLRIVSATDHQAVPTNAGTDNATMYVKFRKSGNDIVISSSPDNNNYVVRETLVNVLSGVPTLYGALYNVGGGAPTTPEISYYA